MSDKKLPTKAKVLKNVIKALSESNELKKSFNRYSYCETLKDETISEAKSFIDYQYPILKKYKRIYGIVHKEKPIIFSSIMWIILDIFIVVGVIIYW